MLNLSLFYHFFLRNSSPNNGKSTTVVFEEVFMKVRAGCIGNYVCKYTTIKVQ